MPSSEVRLKPVLIAGTFAGMLISDCGYIAKWVPGRRRFPIWRSSEQRRSAIDFPLATPTSTCRQQIHNLLRSMLLSSCHPTAPSVPVCRKVDSESQWLLIPLTLDTSLLVIRRKEFAAGDLKALCTAKYSNAERRRLFQVPRISSFISAGSSHGMS